MLLSKKLFIFIAALLKHRQFNYLLTVNGGDITSAPRDEARFCGMASAKSYLILPLSFVVLAWVF